jgi:hypothetical protein
MRASGDAIDPQRLRSSRWLVVPSRSCEIAKEQAKPVEAAQNVLDMRTQAMPQRHSADFVRIETPEPITPDQIDSLAVLSCRCSTSLGVAEMKEGGIGKRPLLGAPGSFTASDSSRFVFRFLAIPASAQRPWGSVRRSRIGYVERSDLPGLDGQLKPVALPFDVRDFVAQQVCFDCFDDRQI